MMSIQRWILIVAVAVASVRSAHAQTAGGPDAEPRAAAEAVGADAADVSEVETTPTRGAVPDPPQGRRSPWRGFFGVEARAFNLSPASSDQVRNGLSLVAQPEFGFASQDRRQRVTATLFGRFALEPHYGSGDVRELNWQYRGDGWSLLAGMNRVFWGAAESRHAIDIINQSDMRESFASDVKLGQLMAAASLQRSWGQVELYALPWFRPRTFPAQGDRPRLQLPLAEAQVDRTPLDWAARVSLSRGDVDLHAYYFHGVNREPELVPVFERPGPPSALRPIYRPIDQVATDVQYARGGWLFKGEVMNRRTPAAQYQSGVAGLEYGINRLFGSVSDLTLLSEFQFDNRPATEWPAPATRGVYTGMRFAINDKASSEARAGVVFDVRSGSKLLRAEFTRRLSDQLGLHFSYYGFGHVSQSRALSDFYRDSYFTITLRRYL